MTSTCFLKIFFLTVLFNRVKCSRIQRSAINFQPSALSVTVGESHFVNVRLMQPELIPPDVFVQFLYDDQVEDTYGRISPLPNITFTETPTSDQSRVIVVQARSHGHLVVSARSPQINISSDQDFLLINIAYSKTISIMTQLAGWIYFFAWSISFYPQILLNYHRQSVIGLNFDFLTLNLIGHSCYAIFNICLYTSREIQEEYYARHPHGVLPVLANDVLFSVHAVVACLITVGQCIFLDRGNQRVSYKSIIIVGILILFLTISTIIGMTGHLSTLTLLNFFSYVKLIVTLIKYVPQAWMNKRRQSTEGWSIGNILLDITGGSLSVIQMFLLAANYNDWSSIFGSPTKLGLGLFSILFDILFMFQHYVLYRPTQSTSINSDERSPLIS